MERRISHTQNRIMANGSQMSALLSNLMRLLLYVPCIPEEKSRHVTTNAPPSSFLQNNRCKNAEWEERKTWIFHDSAEADARYIQHQRTYLQGKEQPKGVQSLTPMFQSAKENQCLNSCIKERQIGSNVHLIAHLFILNDGKTSAWIWSL